MQKKVTCARLREVLGGRARKMRKKDEQKVPKMMFKIHNLDIFPNTANMVRTRCAEQSCAPSGHKRRRS